MSTTTQHTPGPWKVEAEKNNEFYNITDGKWIITRVEHGETVLNMEANARLIASAPELLEALELTVERFEKVVGVYDPEPNHWYSKAKLLIKKAKGE